ncbi:MAG TPA: hypothetical protein VIQ31_24175 [Phormidium sp.]
MGFGRVVTPPALLEASQPTLLGLTALQYNFSSVGQSAIGKGDRS